VNARLDRLQPYPFEKLKTLLDGVSPPGRSPISLAIGEPRHRTPEVIRQAIVDHLDGLAVYPPTAGTLRLREVVAAWFCRRYGLPALDPVSQVLPVNGSREALFAFAQTVVDASAGLAPLVACPNPFYQIYEGAALLAGAETRFLNQTPESDFRLDLDTLSHAEWDRAQLVYVCSPGNPTGHVLTIDEWQALFERADRHGFVIASDECYSEIYPDESAPPLGGLEAAHRLGRDDFRGLVVFTSLSKRSNAPGLRSGAVAGDARLLAPFLRYRTYHGSAMNPVVQHASIAAWSDDAHVRENRTTYREKFAAVVPKLAPVLRTRQPDAGFYLWAGVPDVAGPAGAPDSANPDERFARRLFADAHVAVLPGSYLARTAHGVNPGIGAVRIALVPPLDECLDAARRIVDCCLSLTDDA